MPQLKSEDTHYENDKKRIYFLCQIIMYILKYFLLFLLCCSSEKIIIPWDSSVFIIIWNCFILTVFWTEGITTNLGKHHTEELNNNNNNLSFFLRTIETTHILTSVLNGGSQSSLVLLRKLISQSPINIISWMKSSIIRRVEHVECRVWRHIHTIFTLKFQRK
jgi:hypothetical protein